MSIRRAGPKDASFALPFVSMIRSGSVAKHWSKHFLQSGDQMVGFPFALQQRLYGLVLHPALTAEKIILDFETLDVLCRDGSRPSPSSRALSAL